MKTSDTISKLAEALSKAQGGFKAVDRDRLNPFVGSTYATLAAVLEATREPLSEHGLAVVQTTEIFERDNGAAGMRLLSRLMHVSGEWIESEYPINAAVLNDPQKLGSAITYGRRYSYMALIGVSPEAEDDDGNEASGRKGKGDRGSGQTGQTGSGQASTQHRQAGVSYASQKQINLLDMKGKAKYGDQWPAKRDELISRKTSHRDPKPEEPITDPAQLTSREASDIIDFIQGKVPGTNGTANGTNGSNGTTPAPAATGSGAGR